MDTNVLLISPLFPFKTKHALNCRPFLHFPLPLSKNPCFSFKVETDYSSRRTKSTQNDNVAFDEAAYEAERLSRDAEARKAMAETSQKETRNEDDPKAWKWIIRKRIWDLMEAQNIAQFPRPVHHRIPNFVGAHVAASKLGGLEEFKVAKCVKVNPDTPQKQVRFLTLNAGKKLLTPQPRLRTGFFSILESHMLSPNTINEACTSAGVAKYGRPIGLDEKIKVDLIVIGSVAVNPMTGARLGKGEGFAELEYGMLRYMGAIDDATPIVTTVHDEQLVDNIPVEKLLIHDVPVDIICTPTQIIYTNTSIPKPQGIYWDRLSPEKLGQIKILRELKSRIEQETGEKLPSGPSGKFLGEPGSRPHLWTGFTNKSHVPHLTGKPAHPFSILTCSLFLFLTIFPYNQIEFASFRLSYLSSLCFLSIAPFTSRPLTSSITFSLVSGVFNLGRFFSFWS